MLHTCDEGAEQKFWGGDEFWGVMIVYCLDHCNGSKATCVSLHSSDYVYFMCPVLFCIYQLYISKTVKKIQGDGKEKSEMCNVQKCLQHFANICS